MTLRRRIPRSLLLAAALLSAALIGWSGWAAYAPVALDTRDELFEIPKGTWARRMAGDKVEILPSNVQLTLGANDVLLLRNLDDVPQIFGPVLIMPGQSFRLPFETVSENQFACTAHASGQMSVSVLALPATGLARLQWRARRLIKHSLLSRYLWKN